jgi:hypothetical protein
MHREHGERLPELQGRLTEKTGKRRQINLFRVDAP